MTRRRRSVGLALAGLGGILAVVILVPRFRGADSPDAAISRVTSGLAGMTQSLPRDMRARILASPRDFLQLAGDVLSEPQDLFVLVDKNHLLSPDFAPKDLVNLKDYSLSLLLGSVLVRKVILS
jgi:hypothetical protein